MEEIYMRGKKVLLSIDMDGVTAKWKEVSRSEYSTPGYFLGLEAQENLIGAIRELANDQNADFQMCITSHVINEVAKEEKKAWNTIKDIVIPQIYPMYGSSKAEALKEEFNLDEDTICIHLDDFTKNLREWQSHGENFIGIKWLNGINGTHGTWDGLTLSYKASKEELLKQLRLLVG